MHDLIESRRAEIRALAERHGFREVRVFGSMARGDADTKELSDVDLLVTLPAGRTGLALGALLMDVQELVGAARGRGDRGVASPGISRTGAERSPDSLAQAVDTDLALLEHVRTRIARIREYTGDDRSVFYESHLVRDAVLRNLHTIAESTQRLSDRVQATEPRRSVARESRVFAT